MAGNQGVRREAVFCCRAEKQPEEHTSLVRLDNRFLASWKVENQAPLLSPGASRDELPPLSSASPWF